MATAGVAVRQRASSSPLPLAGEGKEVSAARSERHPNSIFKQPRVIARLSRHAGCAVFAFSSTLPMRGAERRKTWRLAKPPEWLARLTARWEARALQGAVWCSSPPKLQLAGFVRRRHHNPSARDRLHRRRAASLAVVAAAPRAQPHALAAGARRVGVIEAAQRIYDLVEGHRHARARRLAQPGCRRDRASIGRPRGQDGALLVTGEVGIVDDIPRVVE